MNNNLCRVLRAVMVSGLSFVWQMKWCFQYLADIKRIVSEKISNSPIYRIPLRILMGLLCFAFTVHADIVISFDAPNTCANLDGSWSGTSKVSHWLSGICTYHGTGTIIFIDAFGHFRVSGRADKDSGSFLCPAQISEQLSGVCVDGLMTIKTDFAVVTGTLSGNSGSAQGRLTLSPGLDVDVFAQAHK